MPKSWTEKTKNGHTYFYSSVNSDFLQVSIMDDMEDSILLEENQELVIEGIKESMDDCTILSKSIQKNGDFEGFRYSYTGKLPGVGDTLYYIDCFSISYNNRFIQILYVSISDQREQISNYFPNILSSLKKIETTSSPETNNSAIPSENISSSTSTASSTPKTPTVTTSQKNALRSAKQYLDVITNKTFMGDYKAEIDDIGKTIFSAAYEESEKKLIVSFGVVIENEVYVDPKSMFHQSNTLK